MDLLRVKLYILLKGPVSTYSISLVDSINLGSYKVFYYNADFFIKEGVRGRVLG